MDTPNRTFKAINMLKFTFSGRKCYTIRVHCIAIRAYFSSRFDVRL